MLFTLDLDVQQTHCSSRFVEQKLMLGSYFRRDQIHNGHWKGFSHTLLCYLLWTWMFHKPTAEAGLLNKSSCLARTLGVTKFASYDFGHTLLCYFKSDLDVQQTHCRCLTAVKHLLRSVCMCDEKVQFHICKFKFWQKAFVSKALQHSALQHWA
jgi:hypothetical protein